MRGIEPQSGTGEKSARGMEPKLCEVASLRDPGREGGQGEGKLQVMKTQGMQTEIEGNASHAKGRDEEGGIWARGVE